PGLRDVFHNLFASMHLRIRLPQDLNPWRKRDFRRSGRHLFCTRPCRFSLSNSPRGIGAHTFLRRTTVKRPNSDAKQTKMTRRDMLRNTGKAGLTLAAAGSLAPFWLAGTSGAAKGAAAESIKVGILHSLSGFMA